MNATVNVNFTARTGKPVMPLHGFNAGPMTKVFTYDARPWFVEGGFPFVRLHDIEYPYGSGEFVDIPCIFKNFDADENDPASYNFALTDEYIRQSLAVGAKIIYRLGVSIEHAPVKRYTHPPKDYAKWARICEHIIRHYNEGWADGYHWDIKYWEIWNEAENGSNMWTGTPEEFYELYVVSARHLKECFPHLKIGGCGWTRATNSFIEGFFEYITTREAPVPLDFHSWHAYRKDAHAYIELGNTARDLLVRFGYPDAESILDEWNFMYGWSFEEQYPSYYAMKDERGAAFYAATLCALQEHTDVVIGANFEADVIKEFCGILDVDQMCIGGFTKKNRKFAQLKPTKGFYAFKAFNLLYRMGNQVALENDDDAILATAAAGDGTCGALVVNQTTEERSVTLNLAGVCGELVIRVTDKNHTFERVSTISAGDTIKLDLPLPAQSFVYIGTDLPDPENPFRD